jgi:undecaprenyl-diphosphatase
MEREKRTLLAGFVSAGLALAIFAWLAASVLRGEIVEFDSAVRDAVHSRASPWMTRFMRSVTRLGSELIMAPLGLLIAWRLVAAGRRHAAVLLLIASAGGETLNQLLKLLFRRPRPEAFFGYDLPSSYSFPSGHALVSCCFYGALAAILTRRMQSRLGKIAVWACAVVLVGAIGLSRVYLGVHYASDVIAGYSAAVVWVAAVATGYGFWLRRRPK